MLCLTKSSGGLFQLQAFFKSICNSCTDFIIAVGIGVKGDRLKGINIHLIIFEHRFLNGCSKDFADHPKTCFIALVLNKLTLDGNRQSPLQLEQKYVK